MIEFAIFLIGVIAILLTIVIHFTSLLDTRVNVSSTKPLALGTPDFFTALESIAGSPMYKIAPGDIKVLNNGEEFLPDIVREIRNAKHSVTMTNYIWKEGLMMNSIFQALIERAKHGLEIRILMDGKGNLSAPDEKIEALKKAGGKIATFRPLHFRTLTRINKRTHVRAISIDGKIGYIGGAAFDDGWLGKGVGKNKWRDMMFKMTGPAAESVQHIFNALWRQTDGEILSGKAFYPDAGKTISEAYPTESCFIPLFHVPSPDLDRDLMQFIWLSIVGAKKHIRLETPYLLPDINILRALTRKAREGVKVEIMVPGPYIDSKLVQAASRSYYPDVLEAGIRLYEYQSAGFHSKMMTIDGHWSIIGSANLDNRSSTLNVEAIFGVAYEKLAKELEEGFELNKSRAKEITKENYDPSFLTKAFSMLSNLFAKQY